MAKETRAQLAAAMLAHGMTKLAGAEYQPAFHEHEMTTVDAGDFSIMHCRPDSWKGGDELFDIAQGKKLLAMRKDRGGAWELVSMKRGDWESAFLLT